MERIASFSVDHDKLRPGMYISRIDGDVITYDIRMKKPNGGNYLSNGAIHTFEHLFATYVRNSEFAQTRLLFSDKKHPFPSRRACADSPYLPIYRRI